MTSSVVTNGNGSFISAHQPDMHRESTEDDCRPQVNNPSPDDVVIREQLFGAKRPLRVAMLGAGVSGLNFFKFAEEKLEQVEIICYDKNDDIGGTWLENRYPGCACDIPSVVYQFPWRRAPWSKYYSQSPEIWKYLKMVERENNFIEKYVKLQHKIEKLAWNEDSGQWTLVVQDLRTARRFEDHADIVINGTGVLNKWKWPDIPGLHDFEGELLHSAQWNSNIDLKNKRVALIGAGSSAVQILPNIYDQVAQVYTWVRSKIWITAGFAQRFAGKDGANFEYNDEQRAVFEDPDMYQAYCKSIEAELNQRFSFIVNGSQQQQDAKNFSHDEMKRKLQDRPDLLDKIMPQDFFVGCRRPTPGNGYLEALSGVKTTAYTEQLTAITPNGFIDPDGAEHEVDVIICATGFDTSYRPRVPLIVDGVDMGEKWKDRDHIPSYLSVALAEVPNYLVFGGAYCPSAHGSFFPIIQAYTEYALQIIEKMQIERIKSIRPKVNVTEQFLRHADTFLKRTAWTGPCTSWFKGGKKEGRPAIYPGSRLHFLRLLEKVRFEDYSIEYQDTTNIFSFLGTGFHMCERDGSDITWYLGTPDREIDEEQLLSMMDGQKGTQLRRP